VTHASGVLISVAAPAKPGETLVMWAYGLGAVDHPIAPGCCSDPGQLPLTLQPFQLSVFYSLANSAPLRKFAQPAFTYSGMVGAGLYQLHFQVPNAPADLPSCAAGKANLHLLASGPNSSDVADVCLAP
jgi:uncharacterized protein (TIGR03437 family)